jgi:predicted RNA methylase
VAAGLPGVAPYIPAPLSVVRAALEAAWVGPCDTVYDLGAGDGRVVVLAVRDFCAARAVGVEIDPFLAEVARAYARQYGVADRLFYSLLSFFSKLYQKML